MTIPKRGSRLIVVDGECYRWRIRKKPTYCQALAWCSLTVAIEHANHPGTTLSVHMPQNHPSNWMSKQTVPVLPSDVEFNIRLALNKGWKPIAPGSSFELIL